RDPGHAAEVIDGLDDERRRGGEALREELDGESLTPLVSLSLGLARRLTLGPARGHLGAGLGCPIRDLVRGGHLVLLVLGGVSKKFMRRPHPRQSATAGSESWPAARRRLALPSPLSQAG